VGLVVLFILCWGDVPCSATFAYGRPFPVALSSHFLSSFRTGCRGRGPLFVLLSAISIHFPTSQRLPSSLFLRFVPLLRLRILVLLWGGSMSPAGFVSSANTSTHSMGSSSPRFSSRFGAFVILVTSLRTDFFRSGSSLGSDGTSGSCMLSACIAFLSSA